MEKLFKNSWALFAGYAFIMLAFGLQGNLLGVRSVIEEFTLLSTGILMSAYFIGYFIGANIATKSFPTAAEGTRFLSLADLTTTAPIAKPVAVINPKISPKKLPNWIES